MGREKLFLVIFSNHLVSHPPSLPIKKAPERGLFIGREDGIRTHETFRFTHFPGVRLQPLGHLSMNLLVQSLLYTILFFLCQGARSLRVIRHIVCLTLRVIIEEASIMFKIAPGDFSQPLGHLSMNLLVQSLLYTVLFFCAKAHAACALFDTSCASPFGS